MRFAPYLGGPFLLATLVGPWLAAPGSESASALEGLEKYESYPIPIE